jgi:hypothetical protein
LIKCENVDAYAPADAELVLEGRILFDREVLEGPLPDITATYDIQRKQPVIEIVGMMRRENYIYQALLPGGAEHRLLMGMPQEVRVWNYTNNVVPTVKAVNSPHVIDGVTVTNGIHEVTRDISHSPYWNHDIAPTRVNDRKWGLKDIAALWISMSACIPTYMLAMNPQKMSG